MRTGMGSDAASTSQTTTGLTGTSTSGSATASNSTAYRGEDEVDAPASTADRSSPVFGAIASLLGGSDSTGSPTNRFLLLSSPVDGKVSYLMLPSGRITFPLLGKDTGLVSPHGLAIDKARKLLYIADSGKRVVWSCSLLVNDGYLLSDKILRPVADGVEARYIAVDPQGDLFIAEEGTDALLRLSMEDMVRGVRVATPVYSGTADKVQSPNGLWADSIWVTWANSDGGAFSVARAPHELNKLSADKHISVLASNMTSTSLVGDGPDLFFTTTSKKAGVAHGAVYKVKRSGSDVLLLNDKLTKPTGIDTDGTGNIYVADEGQDAVYRLPSAEWDRLPKLDKVIDFPRVFAVTYFELPKTDSRAIGMHSHNSKVLAYALGGLVALLAMV